MGPYSTPRPYEQSGGGFKSFRIPKDHGKCGAIQTPAKKFSETEKSLKAQGKTGEAIRDLLRVPIIDSFSASVTWSPGLWNEAQIGTRVAMMGCF